MDNNFENKLWEKKLEDGFAVPEHYFEGLNEAIFTRLSVEKLKEIAPETGFSVPDGYFDTLSTRVLSAVADEQLSTASLPVKKEAKIIGFWQSNLLKYASVACLVMVSAFGFYFYDHEELFKKPMASNMATEQSLYDMDEQEIIEHVTTTDKDIVTTTSATDKEIENYILNNYSQNDITRNL